MSKYDYNAYIGKYATDLPVIQRDYVQGSDSNSAKRDAFVKMILDSLARHADADSIDGNLDFIYGTSYDDTQEQAGFMPIDGQQRLTTLSLIGWLLSQKTSPGKYSMPRLRYKTRYTTEQFCDCLSRYRLPENYGDLREHLLSEPMWFAERWLNDPSVAAMIDLLEAVDLRLRSVEYKDKTELMADRFFNNNPISFYLLDMNNPLEDDGGNHDGEPEADFRLTEDLYIKMNARGKMLSAFENWKAQFTGMLESRFKGEIYEFKDVEGQKLTIPEYFSYAVEHDWTDFLWSRALSDWEKLTPEQQAENAYPRIDEYFMKLLDYITEVVYWEGFTDENAALRTRDRMASCFGGMELSDMFAGKEGQWMVRRRISVYRRKENVVDMFRMFDVLVSLSQGEGVDGLTPFFESVLYHGEWLPDSRKICVSYDVNDEDTQRFTCNLVELCLNPSFSDAWNIPVRMLLRAMLRYAIRYPSAPTDGMMSYLRVIWGWELAQRQRLVKGMNVRFNLRLETYPLLRDVADRLLADSDVDVALGRIDGREARRLRLEGEMEKRDFRINGYDVELAVLANSPYLKGDFSNVYDALEKFSTLNPGKSFVGRFEEFAALDNYAKIAGLVALGFEGIRTYPHTDRYRFYGSEGHWDYVFASDDSAFRCSFTGWICGDTQKHNPLPDTLGYYILKYPEFISARIGDNKTGYYLYSNNPPFEMTAMTGRYSSRPMNGYNKCPYADTVYERLDKGVADELKLSDWGYGLTHGRLYIGDGKYSLESLDEGWLWRFEEKSKKWLTKWQARFEITPEGWTDREGEFSFKGNYLLSKEGKDRIETALDFINALYDLI